MQEGPQGGDAPPPSVPQEVDWNRLDKTKFFFVGVGLFSSLTTLLFPLTVIKTRQMVLAEAPRGMQGAVQVGRELVAAEGIRGLYKGFGTIILGIIPARAVYLTSLEATKSYSYDTAHWLLPSQAGAAGLASLVAGATASLVTQSVIVPIDVVSQKLMVQGNPRRPGQAAPPAGAASGAHAGQFTFRKPARNGLEMARRIVRIDGLGGLYRGFGASVATFVPSSAIWWGSYGLYQRLVWQQVDKWRGAGGGGSSSSSSGGSGSAGGPAAGVRPTGEVVAVQTVSAVASGVTAGALTNGLDVVKTRLQVAERREGQARALTFGGVARELYRREGLRGFGRGMGAKIASSCVWGTVMVSAFEWLKRVSIRPEEQAV